MEAALMVSPTLLTSEERIRAAIARGESHFYEFKSAWEGSPGSKVPRDPKAVRRDIAEALTAFANADGGELLVGVEDDGDITGVPHAEKHVASFLQAPVTNIMQSTPLSTTHQAKCLIDGKLVLLFAVDKGTHFVHQTADGKCLQRRDRESIPVSGKQIEFERQERISREYDRTFVDGASIDDIDEQSLTPLFALFGRGHSTEKLLQMLELAEFTRGAVRLRRAALLLFAKDVSVWHPRCAVRIMSVAGTEVLAGPDYNAEQIDIVTAPICRLVTDAWDSLRPHLTRTVYSGGAFSSRVSYPEDAVLEALTNAITHRDYSIEGRAIEVTLFEDRLEIRSPGALLSNVTVDQLKALRGVHQSRNAHIARILREMGFVREMGEGFKRIYQFLRKNDLVEPDLSAESDSFAITMHHRSVFSPAAQKWLSAFDRFNLTREERQVVLLGQAGDLLSAADIYSAADISENETERYRSLVESLQLKGVLASTMTQSQVTNKAQTLKVRGPSSSRRRLIKRYRIREPKDCDVYYAELVRTFQRHVSHGGALTAQAVKDIGNALSSDSPYKGVQLTKALQLLGLIDSGKRRITTSSR
ncbi:ATP-binding protein [Streptomyces collinus]